MSKIAFFCIPAHGHTNPTLNVVKELTKKGHEVWYYSYESFREKIENAGGRVTNVISANTNYLINNDINSTSAKNISAKKLNIPIEIFESDIFDVVVKQDKSPCYLCARMRRGYLYEKAKGWSRKFKELCGKAYPGNP